MVDVNSVSYIQDMIWNNYIRQPKEWDLQPLEVWDTQISQVSLFSSKH